MPSHTSLVVDDKLMLQIFADTVAFAKLAPGKLFRVKMTKNKMTSDWSVINTFVSTLSAILEATNGRQLMHRQTVKQLDTFLKSQKPTIIWSINDLDESIDFLRCLPKYKKQ
jgi:hypothetical protein